MDWKELCKSNKRDYSPEEAEAILNGVDSEFRRRGVVPEKMTISDKKDESGLMVENAALRAEVERLKEELRLSKMAEDMALAASEEMEKENAVLAEITAYLEPITKTPAEYCPWGIDVARVVMGMMRKAVEKP